MLKYLYTLLVLILSGIVLSQTVDLQGQASGWLSGNPGTSVISQLGFRYMPEMQMEHPLSGLYTLDADISLNMYGVGYVHNWEMKDSDFKLKPYRIWGRFSTDRFETRIGLQKISFGPAMLIRPLMWFDRIDPRDPLQLTDGIYALLSRYYFNNNANLWGWLLCGNDDTKGWELTTTKKKSVEYGGRVQLPVYSGEIGLTYHHRLADLSQISDLYPELVDRAASENRFGLDGKWDIGIGLWFEGALIHQNSELLLMKYRRFYTVGADYTFAAGNGLNTVFEHFQAEFAEKLLGSGEQSSLSGLLLSYPVTLLDMLSAIIFYDWENKSLYRTLTWQRSYDNWQFYGIGFWNPDTMNLYQSRDRESSFAGKGFYVMVVFSH